MSLSSKITRSCSAYVLQCSRSTAHWAQTADVSVELSSCSDRIRFNTGKLARFADGSAVVSSGHSSVLVTAVSRQSPSSAGFIPLTVDYRQKGTAAGRIPGNRLRRDLGPSDAEILASRMIDRSIRPLFPEGYFYETQVICNLLAIDSLHAPDILAINAASAALALSDIPWAGPVGAVRIGFVNGNLVINPTRKQMTNSQLDLILTGMGGDKIVMMEMWANRLDDKVVSDAIELGLVGSNETCRAIEELQQKAGKPKRQNVALSAPGTDLVQTLRSQTEDRVRAVLTDYTHDKISRDVALREIQKEAVEKVLADQAQNQCDPEKAAVEKIDEPVLAPAAVQAAASSAFKQIFRDLILETGIRADGRNLTEHRRVDCQVNLYEPLHGSSLFQKGQSQVLCGVTFDSPDSSFRTDSVSELLGAPREKKFMLHYEFPPYAINEVSKAKGIGRRELGHGALAEKALRSVIPPDFPFTTRVTAEVLESNGSTSMGAVCGGSLALMDAGVPLPEPVSGVAIGLIMKNEVDYCILTDLMGIEDYMGDMDFKVAGTRTGLTGLQLDVKPQGISAAIILEALKAARVANNTLIYLMSACIAEPRPELKANGPSTELVTIPPYQRAKFVGVGGYNLKKIEADTGARISQMDDFTYSLFAPNSDALLEAKEAIQAILDAEKEPELEFGSVYEARITELKESGIMIVISNSQTPFFVPNMHLDQRKVGHASVLGFQPGDELLVKYFGRDPATGRHRFSRRLLQMTSPKLNRLLKKEEKRKPEPAAVATPWS